MKNRQQGKFTIVANDVIMDNRLSAKAKGVYVYLHSRQEGWQFYEAEIVKNFNDGKHSISSAIKELIECKYLLRIQKRVEGKFSCYEWILNPTESDFISNRKTENGKTETRKSDIGKPDTNNTDSSKTDDINTDSSKTDDIIEETSSSNGESSSSYESDKSDDVKDQEKEKEKSSAKKEKIDYEEIQRIFNQVCTSLPSIRKMTAKRKKAIDVFLKDNSLIDLGDLFKQVEASDFLAGRKTEWSSDFNWILDPEKTIKIQEGNYDNKSKPKEKTFAEKEQERIDRLTGKFAEALNIMNSKL